MRLLLGSGSTTCSSLVRMSLQNSKSWKLGFVQWMVNTPPTVVDDRLTGNWSCVETLGGSTVQSGGADAVMTSVAPVGPKGPLLWTVEVTVMGTSWLTSICAGPSAWMSIFLRSASASKGM